MICAIYARKSTEQNGLNEELPPELREFLVAKLAEMLVVDYLQERTEHTDLHDQEYEEGGHDGEDRSA